MTVNDRLPNHFVLITNYECKLVATGSLFHIFVARAELDFFHTELVEDKI